MGTKIDVKRVEQVVIEKTGSAAVGKFVATVVKAALDLRKDLTREQTSNAMAAYQRAGRRMSALPPYGMMVNPQDRSRLVPVPDEQRVIVRVVELRDAGKGLRPTCRILTEEGYKPRQSRRVVDGKVEYDAGVWRPQLIKSICERAEEAEKKIKGPNFT